MQALPWCTALYRLMVKLTAETACFSVDRPLYADHERMSRPGSICSKTHSQDDLVTDPTAWISLSTMATDGEILAELLCMIDNNSRPSLLFGAPVSPLQPRRHLHADS